MAKSFKVREVIKILEKNGFTLDRHDGTGHRTFKRVDSDRTWVVPVSGNLNDDVPKGTLGSIRRLSGLKKELR